MSNSDSDGCTVISGRENVLNFRKLQIRRALKLEIETDMSHSRGSVMLLANEITGCTSRSKRTAYAALDKWVVENLRMPSAPLRERPARKS